MNETEEEFFKVFNIEPKRVACPANFYNYKCNKSNWDDADCVCDTVVYPEITQDIILRLICFLSWKELYLYQCSTVTIKNVVLKKTMDCYMRTSASLKEDFCESVRKIVEDYYEYN